MPANRTRSERASSLTAFHKILLNTCAVLGTLCLAMAVLALVFGIKPLVFASGSMSPGIPTGSLGLAVPATVQEVAVGDVVSVVNSGNQRITHRVVEKVPGGLVLKGDTNPVPDVQAYPVDQVDRLLVSVPGLGYAVSWLSQPWAYALGSLLCAYLLFIAFRGIDSAKDGAGGTGVPPMRRAKMQQDEGERPRPEPGTGRWPRLAAGLAVVALLAAFAVHGPKAALTQAAFTGTANASSALAAGTVAPATGPLACTESGVLLTTANISWPAQQIPPGARLVLRLQTDASTYGYTNLAAGATTAAYGPGLNLLGLVTSGGSRSMELKLLVVYTTDGNAVSENGSNIGWVSPVGTAPTRNIVYHPGLLLARYFTCS
ncbi:signal peptidase I [Glutamicibacter sp. FBE19]|uniref:signal peptidase I n=1 Tax=Glutamicibacter sp. FBE19 TaxID=2761534 RepID=UPI0018969AB6|nr:signal peptidase I [Glutamicibacter sp. FBE19]MBF6670613.1 signal peptidase I [Glutamicibacter sp. FBE19]